jgi:hypothetical protein
MLLSDMLLSDMFFLLTAKFIFKSSIAIISTYMIYMDCVSLQIRVIDLLIFVFMNAYLWLYVPFSYMAAIMHVISVFVMRFVFRMNIADCIALIIIAPVLCINHVTMLIYLNLMSAISIILACSYEKHMPMMPAILLPYILVLYIYV